MAALDVIDFGAALKSAAERAAVICADAADLHAQSAAGRRDAREAPLKASLAPFGLTAPLTDRQAAALLKLLDYTFSALPIGYVASPLDCPALSVLARMGLVTYTRERVGPLGPMARTLTVWRLERRGTDVAIALKRGELLTAETAALNAANDRLHA